MHQIAINRLNVRSFNFTILFVVLIKQANQMYLTARKWMVHRDKER